MILSRSTKVSVFFVILIHLLSIIICIQSFVVDSSYLSNRNEGVFKKSTDFELNAFLDDIQTSGSGKQVDEVPFFIRQAVVAEIGQAANIVTDAFFADHTNFFTYQKEKLKTYLSLESSYPKPSEKNTYVYFVACRNTDGKVLGFVEIDCRKTMPLKEGLPPRPYMCNLAIDKKWRRNGIATALIEACEDVALKNGYENIYLKVRSANDVAVRMYESLGYVEESSVVEMTERLNESLVLLLKKQLLPIDQEETNEPLSFETEMQPFQIRKE